MCKIHYFLFGEFSEPARPVLKDKINAKLNISNYHKACTPQPLPRIQYYRTTVVINHAPLKKLCSEKIYGFYCKC